MGYKPDVQPLKNFEDDYGLQLEDEEETEHGDEDGFAEGSENDDNNGDEAGFSF